MKMTQEKYESHFDNDAGYCTHCKEITMAGVESDAQEYECSECGNESVMGLDLAIELEHIVVTDEEDEDFDLDEDDDQ